MTEEKPAAGSEARSLTTASASLVLDPASIRLDHNGRVLIDNPKILSAVLSASAQRLSAESANYALCGGNGYCPKKLDSALEEVSLGR